MKICAVVESKEGYTGKRLAEEGVEVVEVSKIYIESNGKENVIHGIDVEKYDCFLFVAGDRHPDIFLILSSCVEKVKPCFPTFEQMLAFKVYPLSRFFAVKSGFFSKFFALYSSEHIVEEASIPSSITIEGRKSVRVGSRENLEELVKDVPRGSFLIEERVWKSEKELRTFATLNGEVIGVEIGEQAVKISVEEELKAKLLNFLKFLKAPFVEVAFVEGKKSLLVKKVLPVPNIEMYEKVTGINVAKMIVESLEKYSRIYRIEKFKNVIEGIKRVLVR